MNNEVDLAALQISEASASTAARWGNIDRPPVSVRSRKSKAQLQRKLNEPWQITLIHGAGDAAEVSVVHVGHGTAEELRRVSGVDEVHAEQQIEALVNVVVLDHRRIQVADGRQPHAGEPRRPLLQSEGLADGPGRLLAGLAAARGGGGELRARVEPLRQV